MEQVTHIIVDSNNHCITICGNRGSQKTLRFHFVVFYDALEYCQSRVHSEHILYLS